MAAAAQEKSEGISEGLGLTNKGHQDEVCLPTGGRLGWGVGQHAAAGKKSLWTAGLQSSYHLIALW